MANFTPVTTRTDLALQLKYAEGIRSITQISHRTNDTQTSRIFSGSTSAACTNCIVTYWSVAHTWAKVTWLAASWGLITGCVSYWNCHPSYFWAESSHHTVCTLFSRSRQWSNQIPEATKSSASPARLAEKSFTSYSPRYFVGLWSCQETAICQRCPMSNDYHQS